MNQTNGAPGHPPAAWAPPSGLGPLPAGLAERARRLAAAQARAVEDLQAAVCATRKHSALVRSVPTAAGSARAVYLDISG